LIHTLLVRLGELPPILGEIPAPHGRIRHERKGTLALVSPQARNSRGAPGDVRESLFEELLIATLVVLAIPVSVHHLDDDDRLSGRRVGEDRNFHVHILRKGRVAGGDLLAPDLDLIHRPAEQALLVHNEALITPRVRVIRVTDALEGNFGQNAETPRAAAQDAPE
jgi:hypothetical protein